MNEQEIEQKLLEKLKDVKRYLTVCYAIAFLISLSSCVSINQDHGEGVGIVSSIGDRNDNVSLPRIIDKGSGISIEDLKGYEHPCCEISIKLQCVESIYGKCNFCEYNEICKIVHDQKDEYVVCKYKNIYDITLNVGESMVIDNVPDGHKKCDDRYYSLFVK